MGIDFSVRFEELARQPNGNVKGKVTLRVSGKVLGQDFDQQLDARNFEFPQGGEQEVYDQDFDIGVLNLKVTASVHEQNAGQCCIQGHAHVDGPIGGGVGKDLDPNCQPIP